MTDAGRPQLDAHNWAGTSENMLVDGQVVPKKTAVLPFCAFTFLAVLGIALALRSVHDSWPLHLLGLVLAVGATVASYTYRLYSTWSGVLVVGFCVWSVVEHATGP